MDDRRYNDRNNNDFSSSTRRDRNRGYGRDLSRNEDNDTRNWDQDNFDRLQSRPNWQAGTDLSRSYRDNQDWRDSNERNDFMRDRNFDEGRLDFGNQRSSFASFDRDRHQNESLRPMDSRDWNRDHRNREEHGSGLIESMKDSVKSFFGKGPKGYQRSDERIKEDVSEVLYRHPRIDASEIEVAVKGGTVTLMGHVQDRQTKRLVEDVVEDCTGVTNEQPAPDWLKRKFDHVQRFGNSSRTDDNKFTLKVSSVERPRSQRMPRGSKEKYTSKQKRQAQHIEDSEKKSGRSSKVAKRIAWATVNKETKGAGKKVSDTSPKSHH